MAAPQPSKKRFQVLVLWIFLALLFGTFLAHRSAVVTFQDANDEAANFMPPPTTKTKTRASKRNKNDGNVVPPPHPHAGARDEFGAWGYLPDPSTRHLQQSPDLEQKLQGACRLPSKDAEGEGGSKVLNKIEMFPPSSSPSLPRVLCLVYTHSNNRDNLQSIIDTWAMDCDGFLAASNQTIPSLNSVDLPHQGPEEYKNMWQKVRSMWAFAYDHFLEDYDYFHM
jgi:hypothetical protein